HNCIAEPEFLPMLGASHPDDIRAIAVLTSSDETSIAEPDSDLVRRQEPPGTYPCD
ncbi:unnamed protein product, partial [Trichogramma brassicae]